MGAQAERARTKRLLAGQQHEIQRLKERIAQLERGSTSQTEASNSKRTSNAD